MTKAYTIISSAEYFSCTGRATDQNIAQAEQSLNLKFADDYREYLAALGSASYFGHELTGLGGPNRVDVVQVTQEQRELNPDVPSNFYVIEETHIDGVVFWQSATGEIFESIPNTTPVKAFDTLTEYVESDL